MPQAKRTAILGLIVAVGVSVSAATRHTPTKLTIRHQVIAVYLGAEGTDPGISPILHEMRSKLLLQTATSHREMIVHGVSLEPSVSEGLSHLATLGSFDEVSVGGNWTNSTVVRYLGGTIGKTHGTMIPQLVLLEREVQEGDSTIEIGPEHEIARYIGRDEIGAWVQRGAPLPR